MNFDQSPSLLRASEPLQKRFGYRFGFSKKSKNGSGSGSGSKSRKRFGFAVRFFGQKTRGSGLRFGLK